MSGTPHPTSRNSHSPVGKSYTSKTGTIADHPTMTFSNQNSWPSLTILPWLSPIETQDWKLPGKEETHIGRYILSRRGNVRLQTVQTGRPGRTAVQVPRNERCRATTVPHLNGETASGLHMAAKFPAGVGFLRGQNTTKKMQNQRLNKRETSRKRIFYRFWLISTCLMTDLTVQGSWS